MTIRTQSELQTQIDTLFAENTIGNLSPVDARSIMTDLNDTAFANLQPGSILATSASIGATAVRGSISVIQGNTATITAAANAAS